METDSREKATTVLVVEDIEKNQRSACRDLSLCHLVMTDNFETTMGTLSSSSCERFDAAIINLNLPASRQEIGKTRAPFGMLLMFEAARFGIRHIAVLADPSDSGDLLYPAFAHASESIMCIGAGCWQRFMYAPVDHNGTKDFKKVLDMLLSNTF